MALAETAKKTENDGAEENERKPENGSGSQADWRKLAAYRRKCALNRNKRSWQWQWRRKAAAKCKAAKNGGNEIGNGEINQCRKQK
jgi:hypothetical protein